MFSTLKVDTHGIMLDDRIALVSSHLEAAGLQDIWVPVLKWMMYVDCMDRGKRVSNRWPTHASASRCVIPPFPHYLLWIILSMDYDARVGVGLVSYERYLLISGPHSS